MRKTNLVSRSGFITLFLAGFLLALLAASNLFFSGYQELCATNSILLFLVGGTFGYGLKELNNDRLRRILITISLLIFISFLGILLGNAIGIISWIMPGYFFAVEIVLIGYWFGRLFSTNYH